MYHISFSGFVWVEVKRTTLSIFYPLVSYFPTWNLILYPSFFFFFNLNSNSLWTEVYGGKKLQCSLLLRLLLPAASTTNWSMQSKCHVKTLLTSKYYLLHSYWANNAWLWRLKRWNRKLGCTSFTKDLRDHVSFCSSLCENPLESLILVQTNMLQVTTRYNLTPFFLLSSFICFVFLSHASSILSQ